MSAIVKRAAETMPLVFDFTDRLGGLAAGARITAPILALTVTPTGDANDLDVGLVGAAIIDQVGELAVQVVATKGRAGKVYTPVCKATVNHAGNDYVFEVALMVVVR